MVRYDYTSCRILTFISWLPLETSLVSSVSMPIGTGICFLISPGCRWIWGYPQKIWPWMLWDLSTLSRKMLKMEDKGLKETLPFTPPNLSAWEHNIWFYADDGRKEGRDPIWVQAALTTMVRMFERVGLQTNLYNTKAVICTPGFIWGKKGAEAYKQQATGEGPTFLERKRTRVRCKEWGETMSSYSLRHHT